MAQYSTKMIFAVLDVSLIMGLNIGETDKVFYINNNITIIIKILRYPTYFGLFISTDISNCI